MNNREKISEKAKGLTGDFLYSMLGLVAMNGVIQLVVYPFLNKQLGADEFGTVLTLISVVAIMASTFGSSANYSRIVTHIKGHDSNGDYNIYLLCVSVFSIVVSAVGLMCMGRFGVAAEIGFAALMIATIFRYYSEVEFRLNLNYKRYFIYYLLVSVGYIAGVVLFYITHSWMITMLCGECFAVLYAMCVGKIYRGDLLKKTKYFRESVKSIFYLAGTGLIASVILNADRIILQVIDGGTSVTIFYAATLIGKMISLVSTPLDGVVIGHLSKYDGGIKKSTFEKICIAGIVIGLVVNVACVGVSYIFIRIMYADIFEMVKPYLWFANLGQVFYFIANTLTTILLRFADEKYQFIISVGYLAVFLVMAIPMTIALGLWGMAVSLVVVNIAKILMTMVVGYRKIR